MRAILFLALLPFSFNLWALTDCGDANVDRNYAYLDWSKASNYQVNSPYITLHGILCIGVNRSSNKIERVHYRDDSNVSVLTSKDSLLRSDVTFLKRTDFPAAAQLVTRNVDPLTIKILSEVVSNDYTDYVISLKFVRNMGRGFSRTDLRALNVKARLYRDGKQIVYYGNSLNSSFDLVTLKVGTTLNVDSIRLLDGSTLVENLISTSLPTTIRN